MDKTLPPDDQRAIIVSIDLLRSNQDDLEQFNSSEFIELARSSGLTVEHHIFSKQNFISICKKHIFEEILTSKSSNHLFLAHL